MADKFPTAKELAAARAALDVAEKAYTEVVAAQSTIGDPIYNGVVYHRNNTAEMKKLQTIADGLKKVQADAKAKLDVVEKPIKDAKQISTELGRQIYVAPGQEQPQGPSRAAAQKAAIDKKIAAVENPPTSTKKPTTKPVTKPVVKPAEVSAADFRKMQEQETATKPATTTTAAPAGVTTGGGGVVTDAIKSGKGRKKKQQVADWASIVQQEFGSLWDVYNANADVKTVLDKAVKEGWYNDETKLSAALTNTGWYRTTEQSARQFAIRQSTDPASIQDQIKTKADELRKSALANGFTFDDATLNNLATNSIKFGWSATQTTNAIGSEAIAQAQGRGAQGMADLRSGFVAQNLRKIAATYAQKLDDAMLTDWTQQIMTGKKTDVQFTDLMRQSASTQFRSLQPQLEKGMDVDTALYAYKQQAAQTLGDSVDVSQIDWTSDKWNKALNYRDEKTGEYRQMDLWEWNKYLRTLPEWQNTNEAKQTYQNVAYALAKGFGKIA